MFYVLVVLSVGWLVGGVGTVEREVEATVANTPAFETSGSCRRYLEKNLAKAYAASTTLAREFVVESKPEGDAIFRRVTIRVRCGRQPSE